MRESTLRQFFEGHDKIQALREELIAATKKRGPNWSSQVIISMDSDFEVTPKHLVLLCDEVLLGMLPPTLLEAVGFCLVASDHFHWDTDTRAGELVADTVFDWASPEINHPLNETNVKKFRERLVTGADNF